MHLLQTTTAQGPCAAPPCPALPVETSAFALSLLVFFSFAYRPPPLREEEDRPHASTLSSLSTRYCRGAQKQKKGSKAGFRLSVRCATLSITHSCTVHASLLSCPSQPALTSCAYYKSWARLTTADIAHLCVSSLCSLLDERKFAARHVEVFGHGAAGLRIGVWGGVSCIVHWSIHYFE